MVSQTLEQDLDSASIYIIAAGGDGAHRPFISLLESLGIPHGALRDQTWGENPSYPPDRYFSLGAELEPFLDSKGPAEIRAIHTAKPRVAARLGRELSIDLIPDVLNELLSAGVLWPTKALSLWRLIWFTAKAPSPI